MDRASQTRSGVEALRRGDARQARLTFERIVAAGEADAGAYLGLAYACAALKDKTAALAAVDRALALQPRDLRALVLKADQLAEAGDARAAASFYRAAVDSAPPAGELPAALRDELRRAQSMCERYAAQFEAFLHERLPVGSSLRFRDSLDILTGRKKPYFQEPRQYFLPGLPQIQFYEREQFPWLARLEAATPEIRGELLDVMKEEAQSFRPYVEPNARLPHTDAQGLLNNPQWSAFYLWKHGDLVERNAARCPRTVAALAEVPFARVPNRSPSVLFSLLRAGAHIPPHTGEVNTRLICHLPLLVPEKCALRVGNDTRTPVEGKAWVFDDTIEHEAWNGSDRTRVILLFEIWRPELSAEERSLVSAMFEAIDAYGGAATKSDL